MTFTNTEVENTSRDHTQMNILLDSAKDEYPGHGSDSKVVLEETAR